jgi:predicted MPP superfamily phosphohydrolase
MFLLANLHLFFKITDVLSLSILGNLLLAMFILFMAVSPLTIHFFSRGGENYSKRLTYISHIWVALLITFFALALSFDIYNLALKHIVSLFYGKYKDTMISPYNILLVSSSVSVLFTLYGFIDAGRLRVERLTVNTSKLPEGIERLRIFQISDLHLGVILGESMLNKVINEIEDVEPDLIVSTGDLLNAELDHIDYLSEHLNRIKPRFGKYAVMGNHESYVGIKHAVEFIEDSGFILLRDESVTVDNTIGIAGMEDIAVKKMTPGTDDSTVAEKEILLELPDDRFRLLLKHRPTINKDSLGLFDLQLSGHTHKGQIFPIHFAIKLFYPYYAGYYKLSNGSAIYTSRGAGTAGPPVRFLAPPEITVIDLVSKKYE